MLTSNDLPKMPSEAQEVVNILDQDGYRVQLLQTNVTSLELYRTLQRGPFNLVWVACHSGETGFLFGSTLITPLELGQFLKEANAENLVLNSCFSADHVTTIQSVCDLNVVATINPTIDDGIAWSSALYLASALARTGDLERAYQQVLTGKDSQYRWFPAVHSKKGIMVNDQDTTINRIERNLERLTRLMYGDTMLHAPGLFELVSTLQTSVKEYIANNVKWKSDTEQRIKGLEANVTKNSLMISRQSIKYMVSLFFVLTILIFVAVFLLRG